MHYVYVIQSTKSGKYYIGSTEDLEKRLAEHNRNIMRSTKRRGPWKVIYTEKHETKTKALQREKRIKRLKGGNGFKRLMKNASPSSSLA